MFKDIIENVVKTEAVQDMGDIRSKVKKRISIKLILRRK